MNQFRFGLFTQILEYVFPKHCFGCNDVHQPFVVPHLCSFCWNEIYKPQQTTYPYFHHFDVYSACVYDKHVKHMILRAKFKQNLLCVDMLSDLLCKTIELIPHLFDVVTSVPSYYSRSFYRGLDLPAILAIEISKKIGVPFQRNLLRKKKRVKRQSKISGRERKTNLQGLFFASKEAQKKNILVIDDILTTGNTALACFKALRRQKPTKVIFLTAAKT